MINWHALLPYLLRSAPVLATALGSPVAGIVTGLVATAFNADPKDIEDIVKRVSTDPDSELKLTELENNQGHIIKSLLFARPPAKIDFHVVVTYDTESNNNVQG
jgi:hypothetical protein